jgi:hypothetical protein
MTPEELDRILASEEALTPSSGFVANVMSAVQDNTSEPSRRHFPWLGFLSGVGATGALAVAASAAVVHGLAPELAYATAALLITFALVSLPAVLDR